MQNQTRNLAGRLTSLSNAAKCPVYEIAWIENGAIPVGLNVLRRHANGTTTSMLAVAAKSEEALQLVMRALIDAAK